MKKTYISPKFVAVELRCTQMLAESLSFNNTTTVSGTSGGWAKEEKSPVNDVNVWDEEW